MEKLVIKLRFKEGKSLEDICSITKKSKKDILEILDE
jgi:DNA-directed RNA polymerase specialized sigma subunit